MLALVLVLMRKGARGVADVLALVPAPVVVLVLDEEKEWTRGCEEGRNMGCRAGEGEAVRDIAT